MSGRYAGLERALIPFLMLGDPDAETSRALADEAIAAGADALELGMPFSDPVADGPVIVAAANRARTAGVTPGVCFGLIARIRARHPSVPIGLLVYANLVLRAGADAFYARAAAAGVDSVLVPDAPLRESAPFRAAARRNGIHPVFIVPPDADDATARALAAASGGYTYVLGRVGVTGADRAAAIPTAGRLALIRAAGAPPVLGFGVSRPEQVRAAIAAGAAGVIVGSALIERVAAGQGIASFVRELKAAAC